VARVRICEGTGKITINGRELDDYFGGPDGSKIILAPLELSELRNQLDVAIRVTGGSYFGQAGAACQGMARAIKQMLLGPDRTALRLGKSEGEDIVEKLREAGYLTRDGRLREQKKYGHKDLRKGFRFSERGGPPVMKLGKTGKIKPSEIDKAVRAVRDKRENEVE
jgi:small subunit ribosomal protein S9